jgi:hypothetical protein
VKKLTQICEEASPGIKGDPGGGLFFAAVHANSDLREFEIHLNVASPWVGD